MAGRSLTVSTYCSCICVICICIYKYFCDKTLCSDVFILCGRPCWCITTHWILFHPRIDKCQQNDLYFGCIWCSVKHMVIMFWLQKRYACFPLCSQKWSLYFHGVMHNSLDHAVARCLSARLSHTITGITLKWLNVSNCFILGSQTILVFFWIKPCGTISTGLL